MELSPLNHNSLYAAQQSQASPSELPPELKLPTSEAGLSEELGASIKNAGKTKADESQPLKEAFQDFVGQTFFSQMIGAFRSTQQPSAYFHGGRAEEIFQGQLDQVLAEDLSEKSADKIAEPMYDLFMLKRQS